MTKGNQSKQSGYFDEFSRQKRGTWIWSGFTATGINLILFLLMPHLMDTSLPGLSIETIVPQVNVIRVKRPETEVKRKTVKPPDPPKTKPDKQPKASRPTETRLTLPFTINPRLPGGPATLDLPTFKSAPPIGQTDIFSTGQLDAPLTTLVRIPPVYPLRARRRSIEGWVRISFLVDEKGSVNNINIIEADPPGIFEQSVKRCVSSWRFKPGTLEGMPVKASVETIIRFELE